MRVLKVQSPGNAAIASDVPKPKLPEDYILVKTAAVALNPTDWKHIEYEFPCHCCFALVFGV